MWTGFEWRRIATSETTINLAMGGAGPPVLLLHGYPQTHLMWHAIAPALADTLTVVAPDLRGYGDSGKPVSDDNHSAYSKRAMARDQVEIMSSLGFERFAVVGHDRGARVGHRMCLDHEECVTRLAVLDIAPTLTMYRGTNEAFARAYFHWFFLIQPRGLPEKLIGGAPDAYVDWILSAWSKTDNCFPAEAVKAYKRAFRDPATIHATCEDYRAAAGIDLEHDEQDAGRKIACPLLALWGAKGVVAKQYDVLATWRERAEVVEGHAVDCGHFLPEEAPEETLAALQPFLRPEKATQ